MRSECIVHPPKEPLTMIRQWQLVALDGNCCAAALLSLFEYWHNQKLDQAEQSRRLEEISSLFQWHNEDELESGILKLYKRDSIRKAIDLLISRNFISIHQNPSERYRSDRTRFFLFHENEVQRYIDIYMQKKKELKTKTEKSVTTNEKSVNVLEKSVQQRLHAEITTEYLGDYSFPSQQKTVDSPLKRDSAQPLVITPKVPHTFPGNIPPGERTPKPVHNESDRESNGTFPGTDTDSRRPISPELPASASNLSQPLPTPGLPLFDQSTPVSAQKRAMSGKAKTRQKASEPVDPRATHPAIVAVREIRKQFPPKELWDEVIATIGDVPDFEKLRKAYAELLKRGSSKNSWYWAIDWYRDGVPEFQSKQKQKKEKVNYEPIDWNKYASDQAREVRERRAARNSTS